MVGSHNKEISDHKGNPFQSNHPGNQDNAEPKGKTTTSPSTSQIPQEHHQDKYPSAKLSEGSDNSKVPSKPSTRNHDIDNNQFGSQSAGNLSTNHCSKGNDWNKYPNPKLLQKYPQP
jgi:hypothetical protein